MSTTPSVDHVLLLPVYQKIDANFKKDKAAELKRFTRQYYASSSNSELSKSSEQEIYESVIDAWKFIQQRKSSTPKIEFIQRKLDKDARRKTATSIYILLDDMPFLIDSIRQGLLRCGVVVRNVNNIVIYVERSARGKRDAGKLKALAQSRIPKHKAEALSCINCAFVSDAQCKDIEKELRDVLKHVSVAVKDYPGMCKKAVDIRESLLANAKTLPVTNEELKESSEFIAWIINNHFTFLGYEEYKIKNLKQGKVIELQKDSMLGVSRYKSNIKTKANIKSLPKGTADLILKKQICSFAKSSTRSKIHRPVYYDYILLKEFDERGNVITEHRFVGLYTSSVYYRAALDIPLVRKKVHAVLDQSGFAPNGHSYKDLLQVINVFPREELFQINKDQLYTTAIEIAQIQETRTCKLFIRKDSYGKFFSCLVYIPRDIYNTKVRLKVQKLLQNRLQATEVEFNTYYSESSLARLHVILRVPEIQRVKYDEAKLEIELAQMVKPWDDYFMESLQLEYPDTEAERLHRLYSQYYSTNYKETYSAEEGVKDIARIEHVLNTDDLALDLSSCHSSVGAELVFKIFSRSHQLYLSDVDPVLENLGLNIISEKTFELQPESDDPVWLHDFSLYRKSKAGVFNEEIAEKFEEAFHAVWQKRTDDDSFNSLVFTAGLGWRDVGLLRAYAAYLKQIQFGYTSQFIAETLSEHQHVTQSLVQYFYGLLDPELSDSSRRKAAKTKTTILNAIDSVVNLAEDSVLRACLNLIDATLRTNFFQCDSDGKAKSYVSFKFNPEMIEGIPQPVPKFEIFVFSRRMEGVHLRGGKVARGGLRWSDRREDYRTEVLGLVKAQQVKNSVIVPVGAKGGFVIKEPAPTDRESFMRQGISCYQTFISGLLDITDNVVNEKIDPPASVVRRDEDDPYLVVAADKGTATFSDIANGIANQYGFWLGDGFASGGSNGYDHKQMGITARGAWVSVQRHFREIDIDVQREDFTVVGIGDMSGDVFGNGMLLSKHICLTAAFNHLHIFIDPDPNAAASFRERQRLFNKPRSSWSDYKAGLISKGGGVFSRAAKSIPVSAQMKARFDIGKDSVTPTELISLLLKSPVDLIWNGGIGTYVKATSESHGEVGDKTNDPLRVNADELRCKVIGEGGNLGFTQQARIEYGLAGGVSLTDFIDNSAGVDCSDHEVNIKILLNKVASTGRLSDSRRNSLLESMTDDVADLVLDNNYSQVQLIGVAHTQVGSRHKEYSELIGFLETRAGLDRALEYLPNKEDLEERAAKHQFLTRPELAVLTSYIKMYLKSELAGADYNSDDYLISYLLGAFPAKLRKTYRDEILLHPLRPEIIATQLANTVVNLLGPSFIYRLADSTASSVAEVVKAAVIAKDIFSIEKYWSEIEALDFKVSSAVQADMMSRLIRLTRRATRWLLRNRRSQLNFSEEVGFFSSGVSQIRKMIPDRLPPDFREMFDEKIQYLVDNGVSEDMALEICRCEFMFPATSFVEISNSTGEKLSTVVDIYYAISEELQLNWLGKIINALPVANYWQALARETYLDDLAWQQRALTCNIVSASNGRGSAKSQVKQWVDINEELMQRTGAMLGHLLAESQPDYAMFSVALRELLNLAQSTAYKSQG